MFGLQQTLWCAHLGHAVLTENAERLDASEIGSVKAADVVEVRSTALLEAGLKLRPSSRQHTVQDATVQRGHDMVHVQQCVSDDLLRQRRDGRRSADGLPPSFRVHLGREETGERVHGPRPVPRHPHRFAHQREVVVDPVQLQQSRVFILADTSVGPP